MSEYYFETSHLAVGYNGVPLIRDICLGIRRGELITLIGPNGSGKSTILKSITKQLRLISGEVRITDLSLDGISQSELSKKMAVMLTDRLKPELMTCRDVAATGRYPYTGRLGILSEEDEKKVQAALEKVHAEEIAERDFNAISDGQRQRILLARAICQEPEIIILDEPTSYLDIRHKLELLSMLRTMAKQNGITVIMSLHEIDLAQKISDRVVCVKGSTIAAFGKPEEIFSEKRIRELYEIESGSYDPYFGTVELAAPTGEPQTLVLSNSGHGIPVYRQLQREGVPFAAAILAENDVDLRTARMLAAECVTVPAFEKIPQEAIEHTMQLVDSVHTVINAGCVIGSGNREINAVLEYAVRTQKLNAVQANPCL